jgi:hypothetical protein
VIRALTMILIVGATAQPAQACHKFTRWNFPWPQRCGLIVKPERQARLVRPAPPERAPDIVVSPDLLDEHDVGLAKLRALLR